MCQAHKRLIHSLSLFSLSLSLSLFSLSLYGRRPGDVTIPVWRSNKGLAIDVAVTCPLASSNLHHKEPCEDYAHHKHAYYDSDFKGTAFEFAAMIFETTGCE